MNQELVLVVEDDPSVARFLTRGLREEGWTVDLCVDGELAVRDTINIMATIDHRFIDGYQLGSVAKIFKRVIEDPWHMEDSPPISDSVADTNAQVLPDSSQERAVS